MPYSNPWCQWWGTDVCYTSPENVDNQCSPAQQVGFDWSELGNGDNWSYDGFNFIGFTAKNGCQGSDADVSWFGTNLIHISKHWLGKLYWWTIEPRWWLYPRGKHCRFSVLYQLFPPVDFSGYGCPHHIRDATWPPLSPDCFQFSPRNRRSQRAVWRCNQCQVPASWGKQVRRVYFGHPLDQFRLLSWTQKSRSPWW